MAPVPAEFSSRSHVGPWQAASASSSAGAARSRPASKPAPRWEPTWRTTPSAPIAQATPTVLSSVSRDFFHSALSVVAQVDEVERVADDRSDLLLLAPLAEELDVLLGMVRRAPGARALREDLDGLAPALDGPVDRRVDPTARGDVGAGQHAAIVKAPG